VPGKIKSTLIIDDIKFVVGIILAKYKILSNSWSIIYTDWRIIEFVIVRKTIDNQYTINYK